ncbi:unnamed protein product [Vitrella brassicaformis CCMP3155]|uniref:lycopene beta-cyclase n=1 Tax=Vitrella brassicaformis (strain CCMP3155) TaxID=1169540 RepID=A0A0G4F4K8_VITBC|nr:unnamed protein product [Vitrella brassicaformis CCMP3155]|eukprot:CEM06650.1 unnamed protein product [Vitrella brassicaformis CCMP3155]
MACIRMAVASATSLFIAPSHYAASLRLPSASRKDVQRATPSPDHRFRRRLDGIRRHSLSPTSSPLSALSATANEADASVDATPLSMDTDVLIVGAGPAGTAMGAVLAKRYGLRVVMIDPRIHERWPNNYGVWVAEWEAVERQLQLGVDECLDHRWEKTDLFLDPGGTTPLRIHRPYARVNRIKLQQRLRAHAQQAGVVMLDTAIDPSSVRHDDTGSSVRLQDGRSTELRTKLIVDCTGHESKLIERDGRHDPGFQIAYGIMCECERHPFDEGAMLFMDYRTDYITEAQKGEPTMQTDLDKAVREPTFLYVMPFGESASGLRRIFLEETSLVARPPMSFDECKERFKKRLAYLGVEPQKIEEEEFCYIPMGGAIPKRNQRVIAFGGAAGVVHAATGYMICRMMSGVAPTAEAIAKEIRQPIDGVFAPDRAARTAYAALWPAQFRRQREFTVFGGEFLMQQNVHNLRAFFRGFFNLELPMWAGFLAGWPGLPHNDQHETWTRRIAFSLSFFTKLNNAVRAALVKSAVFGGGVDLLRALTPDGVVPYDDEAIDREASANEALRSEQYGGQPLEVLGIDKPNGFDVLPTVLKEREKELRA